ncbi:MAG: LysR family transcriptional regulator [Firmicutes bacterium]|nr:LysR family transcriptional regulator [Bacillota bacterium]
MLNKYEAFIRTVELGSLSKAADDLGYTQSGVSHMIRSLEEELGFKILIRSRAGIRLTDAGEQIYPAICGMMDHHEQLKQIVYALRGMNAGTVRIGTFTSVAVHWLPDIIKEFQQDFPHIQFKLLNGDYYDVEKWLRKDAVDVGFVHIPVSDRYHCIPLLQDRLLAILPQDHPLTQGKSFPIAYAAKEPFISLPDSSAQDVKQVLKAANVSPKIKFTTKDDYAILSMVEHGLGMSIVPELLLTGHSQNIAALELDPPASRTIALAFRKQNSAGPATGKFIDYICQWVARRYPHHLL